MFTAMVWHVLLVAKMPARVLRPLTSRGPYETREECVMRVHQMVTALQMTMPVPMDFRFKCKDTKEGVSL